MICSSTTQKTLLRAGLFAVAVLLGAGSTARADDSETQVWRGTNGEIVHNTYGQCVRSRWDIQTDVCAPKEAERITWKAPTPPQPLVRTVYFAFDKSFLTDTAKSTLDSLAGQVGSNVGYSGVLQIIGSADRIGTAAYNEKLSERRADSVRDYLSGTDNIGPASIQTRWVGKSEPTTHCAKTLPWRQLVSCLQPDRRAQVILDFHPVPQK